MAATSEKGALPQPASSASSSNKVDALWISPATLFSREHLMGDVDGERSTFPLAAYCFMTGFMCVLICSLLCCPGAYLGLLDRPFSSDVVCFSAVFVWCAFQTGNTVQVRTQTLAA